VLKYTIVPDSFFEKGFENKILSQAVQLDENDKVTYQELPEYKAVLVYAVSSGKPFVITGLIRALHKIGEFNKLAVSYDGAIVNVALATGENLKIVNSYPAADEVTAEYFILSVLKRFQVNPKVTVINIFGKVPFKLQNDLFRYFKGVETICE